ncbi:tryptophan 7-halogenase [Sphingomonas sp. UYP23]
MSGGPLRTVAVVGDGVAGWLAAVAFARRIPGVRVALVAGGRAGLADRLGGTTPAVHDFHHDLRIDTRRLIVRTGAALRLGTQFDNYVHAFGPVGAPIGGTPFVTAWRQSAAAGSFDAYSPAAQLGLAGKAPDSNPLFADTGYGLQLDPAAYRAHLAAYAEHFGIAVTAARAREPVVAEGRVTALQLEDGSDLIADLYIDATNAPGLLIGALDDGCWRDWSQWLPCDTIVQVSSAPLAALPSLDRCATVPGGWRITTALPRRTDHAVIYDSAALSDGEAATILGASPTAQCRFRNGRRERAWVGNVVAIGDAHATLEPLEASPLHLLYTQIDRLVSTLPGRDFAPVELAHYNRETNEEVDRLRDFVIAHRRDPCDPPPELADTLALFAARGRWRQRDGEGFSRDAWQAVLFGLGVRPCLADPVAQVIEPRQLAATLSQIRQRLASAVAAAPTHRTYLESLAR